jgi:hypothetical protein
MPRLKTQSEVLTIGQLAKRLGIGRDHARALVDKNIIRDAFTIPSAGRFGKAVRIPLASVLQAQREWTDSPAGHPRLTHPDRHRQNGRFPKLKHFPELRTEPQDDTECPEDEQH